MMYLDTDQNLADLKDMLRILTNDDDRLLRSYLQTAEVTLQTAVGKDDDKFYQADDVKPLYQTACYALAGTLYTYRVSVTDSVQYPVNDTYNAIVGALRGLYLNHESKGDADG
ncbi:head-tail connector protein [Fructilactobacillus cliffordii]|uniref:head-tail connector protein n=1 Tax=Fructilactobacillus cliffordii TaxID=2940299 RepID=UPI002093EDA0|nr:head-tail connector protein [Fructilactobacillus cliffordii]USS86490.1 head-tail connector protein [Fructilactobacillus cliffordii]